MVDSPDIGTVLVLREALGWHFQVPRTHAPLLCTVLE